MSKVPACTLMFSNAGSTVTLVSVIVLVLTLVRLNAPLSYASEVVVVPPEVRKCRRHEFRRDRGPPRARSRYRESESYVNYLLPTRPRVVQLSPRSEERRVGKEC